MAKTGVYSITYDKENDLHKVCLEDGEDLNNYIPDILVREIAMRTAFITGDIVAIADTKESKNFSRNGKTCFIDINCRKFSQKQIEEILNTGIILDEEESIDKISKLADDKFNSTASPFVKLFSIFRRKK